jgi:vacuolar-type H+-ATPase subunit C/Vma6
MKFASCVILIMKSTTRSAYMIDNVILLITGTLHERDTHEILQRCHPLGVFDTMPALCVATNVEELYQSVLVETALGMSSIKTDSVY